LILGLLAARSPRDSPLAGSLVTLFLGAGADRRVSRIALLERPGHHRDGHAARSHRLRSGRVVLGPGLGLTFGLIVVAPVEIFRGGP